MTNPPYNAVMVDLETMSTQSNAAIISIGAVRFWLNVKQAEFTDDQLFDLPVDLDSSIECGLHIEPKTVKWWMNQSDEARRIIQNNNPLQAALNSFKLFIPKNAYIFGNGSTFDNVIIRNAFKAANVEYPVSYKQDVCYRTLCKLSDSPLPVFEGTKHNALDDAKAQTRHLMEILEKHPWVKF